MSVKKLLILTAAGIASVGATAVMAGGPDMMAPPAPVESYFYVEGNIGYAFQNYSYQADNDSGLPLLFPVTGVQGPQGNGVTGGLVYGADFGYMFNQYIGLELGWTYLPRFNGVPVTSGAIPTLGLSLRNAGAAWFVSKLVAPLTESFNAFFKAGVSYKYGSLVFNQFQPAAVPSLPSVHIEEWRPVFGAGVAYNFAEDWMASLSWMHIMGGRSYSPRSTSRYVSVVTPASDLLMLSIGYKFVI